MRNYTVGSKAGAMMAGTAIVHQKKDCSMTTLVFSTGAEAINQMLDIAYSINKAAQ